MRLTSSDEDSAKEVSSDCSIDNFNGGPEMETNSPGQYSLLHYACSAGDPDIFLFIRSKCHFLYQSLTETSSNQTNETPLHWAVSCNNIEIVGQLIQDIAAYNKIDISLDGSKTADDFDTHLVTEIHREEAGLNK